MRFRLDTGFSFVFISKMLECIFKRAKKPTKTQHKFSVFVRISPFFESAKLAFEHRFWGHKGLVKALDWLSSEPACLHDCTHPV